MIQALSTLAGLAGHYVTNFGAVQVSCDPSNPGFSCDTGLPGVSATGTQFHSILQIVLGVVAAITVLVIVVAALRMVVGQGDPARVSQSRNTIIYALLGLVLVLSAEAIVSFVVTKL